jgi:hypothetical protein
MEKDKITSPEAMRILGVSQSMVQYLITSGRIKPVGKFAGAWILDRKQIEYLKREREGRNR